MSGTFYIIKTCISSTEGTSYKNMKDREREPADLFFNVACIGFSINLRVMAPIKKVALDDRIDGSSCSS